MKRYSNVKRFFKMPPPENLVKKIFALRTQKKTVDYPYVTCEKIQCEDFLDTSF